MNLEAMGGALRRQWIVVGVGFAVATLLTLLTVFQVGSDGITYREPSRHLATFDLLVTERGFPYGRAVEPQVGGENSAAAAIADTGRLVQLTSVYAEIAVGDPVQRLMAEGGAEVAGTPVDELLTIDGDPALTAAAFTTDQGRSGLPLLQLAAVAGTPEAAVGLVRRQATAFRQYLANGQSVAGIPANERVILTPLSVPDRATNVTDRSPTAPAAVFLGVMLVFVGIALGLDNLNRRRNTPDREEPLEDHGAELSAPDPAADELDRIETSGQDRELAVSRPSNRYSD